MGMGSSSGKKAVKEVAAEKAGTAAPAQQPPTQPQSQETEKLATEEVAAEKSGAIAPAQTDHEMAQFAVTVQNLPGVVMATVSPVPRTILELKTAIEAETSVPVKLQKLIECEGLGIYEDSHCLSAKNLALVMVVDETAQFAWDVADNPSKDQLELEGSSIVSSPRLRTDYCNVLTQEPIRKGAHYFEFVMHHIGDEQWCGVVKDPRQRGPAHSGRSLSGWTYYCGRMSSGGSIRDGLGALHAEGRAVKEFKKLQRKGDIIGMLVDLETGAIAFDLNGELQGACAIPKDTPMWVLTHLDTKGDRVELRKPSLLDAPPANVEALKGALLEISKGLPLRGGGW